MSSRPDIHEKVLSSSSTEELMATYDEWAKSYEQDVADTWGYYGPAAATEHLTQYVDPAGAKVLDAGCGTGLVGVLLKQKGFTEVHGIDYSAGMLAQAEQKAIYASLEQMDMNQPLPLESAVFDAVTCVGTFTGSHVKPEAFRELARVTKPGGMLSCTVRTDYWEASNCRNLLIAMDGAGEVVIEEIRKEPYILSEQSTCHLVVLRAC
jgi:ubiquinone/menaquinone biosynthesis C-methylase UbiE